MPQPTHAIAYTGAQVEDAIKKALPLEEFTHVSDEIVDSKIFHVLWKVAPAFDNAVSGLSIHPDNGQLCEVISEIGSVAATAVKTYAPSPKVEDDTLILNY